MLQFLSLVIYPLIFFFLILLRSPSFTGSCIFLAIFFSRHSTLIAFVHSVVVVQAAGP